MGQEKSEMKVINFINKPSSSAITLIYSNKYYQTRSVLVLSRIRALYIYYPCLPD